MANRQTAKIANANLLTGSKLYIERARVTLPYLVRQAKAREPIYYSELAIEVDIPNARNLNYVLGAIGNALFDLSNHEKLEKPIPPIQCLVINKATQLPGDGVGWFISKTDYSKLTKTQKQELMREKLIDIYHYPYWDWVLEQLALDPIPPTSKMELEIAGTFGSGGESEEHKLFKQYIARNPHIIGLSNIDKVDTEVVLPSADKMDVVFYKGELIIGVEVKSLISPQPDIIRGLFQCVKYKHLIEAKQIVEDQYPNSRVILALQGKMPVDLLPMKNMLAIEVIDNIGIT